MIMSHPQKCKQRLLTSNGASPLCFLFFRFGMACVRAAATTEINQKEGRDNSGAGGEPRAMRQTWVEEARTHTYTLRVCVINMHHKLANPCFVRRSAMMNRGTAFSRWLEQYGWPSCA